MNVKLIACLAEIERLKACIQEQHDEWEAHSGILAQEIECLRNNEYILMNRIKGREAEIERLRNDVQEAHDKTAEVRTAWKHLADENERLRERESMCHERVLEQENERLHKEHDCILDDMDDLRESLRLHDKAAELSAAENERLQAALEECAIADTAEAANRIAREALNETP